MLFDYSENGSEMWIDAFKWWTICFCGWYDNQYGWIIEFKCNWSASTSIADPITFGRKGADDSVPKSTGRSQKEEYWKGCSCSFIYCKLAFSFVCLIAFCICYFKRLLRLKDKNRHLLFREGCYWAHLLNTVFDSRKI